MHARVQEQHESNQCYDSASMPAAAHPWQGACTRSESGSTVLPTTPIISNSHANGQNADSNRGENTQAVAHTAVAASDCTDARGLQVKKEKTQGLLRVEETTHNDGQ